jgi:hypothetical protein
MHDLDRTMGRTHLEAGFGQQAEQEYEYEYSSEQEQESKDQVLHEEELDELASELLGVSGERELEQFLGDLVKKVSGAAGNLIRSPLAQQVGSVLKGAAKEALPVAGAAIGNAILPGAGGVVGGAAASKIGSLFGLELEGLSFEDSEFEVAKQFVRLAADTAHSAATSAPGSAREVAERALSAAAQKYAPGLRGSEPVNPAANSGRWVREGRKLILYGA